MTYLDQAKQYAEKVMSGQILSCEATKLACYRFLDDLARIGNPDFPYHWDEQSAARFIKFAESTKLYNDKWAGENLKLQEWQIFFFAQLYGWKKDKDNLRRFRKAFLQVARKAGKSTMIAVPLLYDLLTTPGAQAYTVATTREQASIVYKCVKEIVRQDEQLSSNLHTYKSTCRIVNPFNSGVIAALASESNTLDGLNCSCAVVDEIGAHRNSDLVNILESSMGSRPEPLLFMIGSATDNMSSPGKQEHDACLRLLRRRKELGSCNIDGKSVEDYLCIVYEIDPEDDWKDSSCYGKANPGLGISPSLEFLESYRNTALMKPSAEVEFVTKCLGRYRTSDKAWISQRNWEKVISNADTFKLDLSKPYTAVAGIDLSKASDLTSYTICFYQNEHFFFEHRFYFPEDSMKEKIKTDNELWYKWIEEGYLIPTIGKVIDYRYLYDDIRDTVNKYDIKSINFDPYNSLETLIPAAEGLPCDMIEVDQGFRTLSPMLKDYETAVLDGKVVDPNPVMKWMNGNAIVKANGNNIKVYKENEFSGQRIDGIVTSAMAVGRLMQMIRDGEIDERSWEERNKAYFEMLKSISF